MSIAEATRKRYLRLGWEDFIEAALEKLSESHPVGLKPELVVFLKRRGYEPDSEVMELPDYVEIELSPKETL